MPKHPLERALEAGGFRPDHAQREAIARLRRLYDALCRPPAGRGLLARWLKRAAAPARGMYLWGGVGRGKTHLVDTLFESLPFEDKLRLHFHRFMQLVHEELKQLESVAQPLQQVGERFAARARVLCLDEMHVNDITDAMLIHGLLQALFERGVTLVTTSNLAPRELYRDGLQRERFVPAIALLEQHTEVVELAGDTDYRLRTLERAEIYHTPLDAAAHTCLAQNFHDLVAVERRKDAFVIINSRDIPVVRWADGIAWFDFDVLCNSPRSKNDYIEIARYFHTVLVGNIPLMDEGANDQARRFVDMVDEFYDRNVKLIASAAAAPRALYNGSRLGFEFERTASRLQEMQTHDYLAREHLG